MTPLRLIFWNMLRRAEQPYETSSYQVPTQARRLYSARDKPLRAINSSLLYREPLNRASHDLLKFSAFQNNLPNAAEVFLDTSD